MGLFDDIWDGFSNFIDDVSIGVDNVMCGVRDISEYITEGAQTLKNDVHQGIVDITSEIDEDLGANVDKALTSVRNIHDTFRNPQRHKQNLYGLLESGVTVSDCSLADHLYRSGNGAGCMFYTHHAIYVGDGQVIHYAEDDDGDVCVHETSFEHFANGHTVHRMPETESPLTYSPSEAVRRARSRLYEQNYNLAVCNCENFVRWCRSGTSNNAFED